MRSTHVHVTQAEKEPAVPSGVSCVPLLKYAPLLLQPPQEPLH